jgi:hypothetical protein
VRRPATLWPDTTKATVLGVRPNSPILHKIAATGEKPLHYTLKHLPEGLRLDEATGILTGKLSKPGDHILQVGVANRAGAAERLRISPLLCLPRSNGAGGAKCSRPSVGACGGTAERNEWNRSPARARRWQTQGAKRDHPAIRRPMAMPRPNIPSTTSPAQSQSRRVFRASRSWRTCSSA